jgi:Regulator of G protein signaling domain
MSLCRHYVRELRRSVLVDTPQLDTTSKRSSQVLENIGDIAGPSDGTPQEKDTDARLSAFLRSDGPNHSPHGSIGSNKPPSRGGLSQTNNRYGRPSHGSGERPPRPSFMSMSTPEQIITDSNSPQHTVTRADIRASAEKLLYTYLLRGSEREIVLPEPILNEISSAIEEQGRDDPEVFDEAKDYVFQAMERDAYPGFLRAKALGNLVPPSSMLRLILGLLGMFGGFWTAFVLIFLDYSRATRAWVSIHLASSIILGA